MKNIIRSLIALIALFALALLSGCLYGSAKEDTAAEEALPARIAVVVDESASFQDNLATAARITTRVIRKNALAGDSEIYLISMDRNPRVLAYFPAEELLKGGDAAVLKSISATTPEDGTDVVGALRLAEMKLHRKSSTPVEKHILLVFSDMYVDAATTPYRKAFESLTSFQWERLKDVDNRFYFVAPAMEPVVSDLLEQRSVPASVLGVEESKKVKTEDIDKLLDQG